ncbi:MAG: hypothetical protein JNM76_00355 [Betaproteobacteria bacterium]|nr:hypothetical protein [Betaproteobacteria bacterium]
MMMACGGLLLLMGVLSGLLLTGSPFGLGSENLGWVTWVLFPGFTLIGYAFLILPARTAQVVMITRVCGGLLLLLATLAAVGLFVSATGVKPAVGDTLVLWYVLVLGLILGPTGLAVQPEKTASTAG